ncbi:hypothetical protein [Bacillus nitratireducens]|uniref:hypothetical protein n=1 Tax=Bacillus nitratireducens TaxID=2026193 RepID=UPI0015968614|nr:hypothetical protein [Bacillus nitratireducens]MED0903347.1 hypothetical protein [Bacillus nitratireducens]
MKFKDWVKSTLVAGVIAEAAMVIPPMTAAIFLASDEVCLNWALARSSASIIISIKLAI